MKTSQKPIIQQVYADTAKCLVQDKASKGTVKDKLIEQGVNKEMAENTVIEIVNQ